MRVVDAVSASAPTVAATGLPPLAIDAPAGEGPPETRPRAAARPSRRPPPLRPPPIRGHPARRALQPILPPSPLRRSPPTTRGSPAPIPSPPPPKRRAEFANARPSRAAAVVRVRSPPSGGPADRASAPAPPAGFAATRGPIPISGPGAPVERSGCRASSPAHVRGKCHTRGSVARAVVRWIERSFSADARDDVLLALPAELAEAYRNDGFNSLVWYDLEALDTFLEAAAALVLGGDAAAWRTLAREHFDRDIGPIFRRHVDRAGDPSALLKRSVSAWSRLYDFATVRVADSTSSGGSLKRVSLLFDGFDAASLALRNVTIGIAEGLLKQSAGSPDVTSRLLAGESSFVRDFEFELTWPAREPDVV